MENGCTQPEQVCAAMCLGRFYERRSVRGGFRRFSGKPGQEFAERRVDETVATEATLPASPSRMRNDRAKPWTGKGSHLLW